MKSFQLQLEEHTVYLKDCDCVFDEKAEHENDLRWESLMAEESEYGPVNNQQGENQ